MPGDTRLNIPSLEWLKESTVNDAAKIEKVKLLAVLAGELDTTLPRMALAWCLKNPDVSTVITGASKVEQLKDNLHALETVPKLTDEVMQKIEGILQNKPAAPKF